MCSHCLSTSSSAEDTTPPPKPSSKASDHKNENFLKSAWHKMTGQHDNLEQDTNENKEKKEDEEEPKKASGSG